MAKFEFQKGNDYSKVYDDKVMKNLAEEYVVLRNAKEISLRENIPLQTIYYYIRKFNLQKPRRTYSMNEDYFAQINTEAKAYLLGFIMADGCVNKTSETNPRANRLIVNISHKDRIVLEFIKQELNCEYEIDDYIPADSTYGTGMMSCLTINSIKMCDDLAKRGISLNKTGDEYVPKIRRHLVRHFLRGFFDGDGHARCYRNRSVTIGFTSASVRMLEDIKEHLNKKLKIVGVASILKDYNGRNAWNLKYHTAQDTEAITKYMYKDAQFFLDRKYSKLT